MANIRAEANEASLQRKKEREEQMKILTEMGKIKYDKNDYKTAIATLTRGMDNLTKLYQNWVRLQEFFGKIESFIEVTVVKNMEDLIEYSDMIFSGKMKITGTSAIENRIRITTKNVINIFSCHLHVLVFLSVFICLI